VTHSLSIQPSCDVALAVELRTEFQELMSGPIPRECIDGFREANRSHFEAGFRDRTVVVLVAVVGGATAGCAMLQEQRMIPNRIVPTGRTGMVLNVMVREGFRRQGVGEALMRAIEEEARRRGLDRLDLKATEKGEPLYRKSGWGDPEGGKPMERYLAERA